MSGLQLWVAASVPIGAALLMVALAHGAGAVTITDDYGGRIRDYLIKYRALERSSEPVVIDGVCGSACTILLGIIPASRICVTPRAAFQFHAAWDQTPNGGQVINPAGNSVLLAYYPRKVKNWIGRHGGLRAQILTLEGAELAAMYPRCR